MNTIYKIDVMSRGQKIQYWLLVSLWLASVIKFTVFWYEEIYFASWVGLFLVSLVLFWQIIMTSWYFYFAGKMKKTNPALEIPKGRVAIIVTKAPSEPWSVLRKTLGGMMSQKFPYSYDVWLADEDPAPETIAWCKKRGVRISCRKNQAGYHNDSWPRRKKCKEGNLAYFYDTHGYAEYDFVVQLDADHIPTDSYLEHMIRPFADPRVGYVAAPSICDSNASASWVVKARLQAEAGMHGTLQSGLNDGWNPLCFGSHYAVRTKALKQVGGLGPELAEDNSTTMLFASHGWKGAFALEAVAHGDGPETFGAFVTQEFQWARSLGNIFIQWLPKLWKKFTFKQKVQFSFTHMWYPMFSLQSAIAYFLPGIAILTKRPAVVVDYLQFITVWYPTVALMLITVFWLYFQGFFRPKDTPPISWQVLLYQLTRWPWVIIAEFYALFDSLVKKEFAFKVTPKNQKGPKSLSPVTLLPYFGVVAFNAYALTRSAEKAFGYYYFALYFTALYIVIILTILFLHLKENRRELYRIKIQPVRFAAKAYSVLIISIIVAAWPISLRAPQLIASVKASANIQDVQIPDKFIGAFDPNQYLYNASEVTAEHSFVDWRNPIGLKQEISRIRLNNRFPIITIEPWPKMNEDPIEELCRGNADKIVIKLAQAVREEMPQHVVIRFAHEMDLDSYPWASGDAEMYTCAFRKFVEIFRQSSATNAVFMWSPSGEPRAAAYYPGESYVDMIGITMLSHDKWDHLVPGGGKFDDYWKLRRWVVGFDKPIVMAELGTSNNQAQTQWLSEAFTFWKNQDNVVGIVLFNDKDIRPYEDTYPDWTIDLNTFSLVVN